MVDRDTHLTACGERDPCISEYSLDAFAGFRRETPFGTQQLHWSEICERLVRARQRPVIASVADNSRGEDLVLVAVRLTEDVLATREAAVASAAEQAALRVTC